MSDGSPNPAKTFPPTRWSLVLAAEQPEILDELCLIYWTPIYHFLRRSGRSREDAEDLTQSFFADLLKGDTFTRAKKESGLLRSFLLGALKRHLAQHNRFQMREKRGARKVHVPLATSELDFDEAEHQYAAQPVEEVTPETLFDRRWVVDLLVRASNRLQRDYEAAGKGREYALLKGAIMTTSDIDNVAAARALGVKEASVRVLVHRLRKNFRAAFKEEILETVSSRTEAEAEYRRMLQIFS